MAYVYLHRKEADNSIFYIGIGCDKDYARSRKKSNRSMIWKRYVAKYGRVIEIVADNLLWEEAIEKEKELISFYGRLDKGTGLLINMTDGGDGSPGMVRSDDVRARISASMKGKVTWMKGRIPTAETRAKLSAARMNRLFSEATKAKIGAAQKNKIVSAETRAKLRAAFLGKPAHNKGQKATAEQRLKNSQSHIGLIPWNKGKKGCQVAWNKGLKKIKNGTAAD
jgi:hypothetical protein